MLELHLLSKLETGLEVSNLIATKMMMRREGELLGQEDARGACGSGGQGGGRRIIELRVGGRRYHTRLIKALRCRKHGREGLNTR